jgi:hypothetical protein
MKTKIIIAAVVVILVILLGWQRIFPSAPGAAATMQSAPISIDPATLPGIQSGNAPWSVELSHLKERLSAIGLAALPQEGTTLHIHQHLDITINGSAIQIPSGIGINETAGYISPIHVHDQTGIIHVESPLIRDFTLGEFFDIWGVRFTKDCIGSYCASGTTNALRVYVNGQPFAGNDPRALVLAPHQEIAITYGSMSAASTTIPSAFTFPAGY